MKKPTLQVTLRKKPSLKMTPRQEYIKKLESDRKTKGHRFHSRRVA